MIRLRRRWLFVFAILLSENAVRAQKPALPLSDKSKVADTELVLVDSILNGPGAPIDLSSALRLAGVANPEILLARERVVEAVAIRQLAAAQLLPNLNAGTSIDLHHGPLQQ